MAPVEVQLISRAGIVVAVVRGEIDLDGRDCFEAALGPVLDGDGPAVLDLAAVPFMDSSGLHVIVQLSRRLQREGRRLALASCGSGVRRLLELTALDRTLAIYDDAEAAVHALRNGEEVVNEGELRARTRPA